MAWSTTRPGTNPKYQTKEHRDYLASLKRQLGLEGYLTCRATECVMPSRAITNPNGNARDGLTAGHNPDGVTYNGPEHRACNLRDAAIRANARSHGKDEAKVRRWVM